MTEEEFQKGLQALHHEAKEQELSIGALDKRIWALVRREARKSRDEIKRRISRAEEGLARIDAELIDWSRAGRDMGVNGLMMEGAYVSIKAAARNLVATQLSQNSQRLATLEMEALTRAMLYVTIVVLLVTAVGACAAIIGLRHY